MSASSGIEISGVRKAYNGKQVLNIESLVLEPGCAHAVIGPNGAGKSTLLRILAKTMPPTAGTFAMPHGSVGYLPQKPYVFGFSVFKNVAIALDGKGMEARQVAEAVERALDAVGMADMADQRGSSLSGGEAQRVALARLLAAPHQVLLLDEPTSAMDVQGTVTVERAIADYLERNGAMMVMSTHAPSQAMRATDRTVALIDGEVAESGPTKRLIESPSNPQVAEFLSYWRL